VWSKEEDEGKEEGQEEEVTRENELLCSGRDEEWLKRRKHPRRPGNLPRRRVTTEERKSVHARNADARTLAKPTSRS
jgi:hypothetical protein